MKVKIAYRTPRLVWPVVPQVQSTSRHWRLKQRDRMREEGWVQQGSADF